MKLQDRVGEKIRRNAESRSCYELHPGAACAMVLGTAATITGTDEEKRLLIPNLPDRDRK